MSPKLLKLDELLNLATAEYRRINDLNKDDFKRWLDTQFIPPTIPFREGRSIPTSAEGLDAVREFGRRWRLESEACKELIGEKEVAELAVRVYGEMLDGTSDAEVPPDTDVIKAFKQLLESRLSNASLPMTHHFPCQIFSDPIVPAFEIGPVIFHSRSAWLEDIAHRAGKMLTWTEKVAAQWQHNKPVLRPIATEGTPISMEDWNAWDVAQEVGTCEWIASVTVSAHEQRRSREIAEAAARIALDTIGLPLPPSIARRIRGVIGTTKPSLSRRFAQIEGDDLRCSTYSDLPAFKGPPGADAHLIKATEKLRVEAGKALLSLTEGKKTATKFSLYRRWLDAMYWFGAARQDPTEFIGLVKVGIALDVLAKGGRTKGILELVSALFNCDSQAVAMSDGRTLKEVITAIYEQGRSQLSHGGATALMSDLPHDRDSAVVFTSGVLVRYLECLSLYDGSDNYKEFLTALPRFKDSSPFYT